MRAFHFDLKRAMWRRAYMDTAVECLRRWGFNTIVCEVEDKLRSPRHTALAHPDAWSHEEAAAFAHDCRRKGVEVIPLVQSLGHAEYVVSRPEYAHLREAPEIADQYDPLSEEARALIVELFDDAIQAFQPRGYFHMGGDETWSLGTSKRCAAVVREVGVGGLYLRHMMPLFEHVQNRGLQPIIWADMVLTHPEIIPDIPDYVVLMDWDYWTREQRPDSIRVWGRESVVSWDEYAESVSPEWKARFGRYAVDERTSRDGTFRSLFYAEALREAGFEVLTASAARSMGDMVGTPANEIHWPNAFYSARTGAARAGGNLVTSWAVRHNHPELSLPVAFGAAQSVEDETAFDAAALGRAFTRERYGVEMPEFTRAACQQSATAIDLGQAHQLLAARQKLQQGRDPVTEAVAEMERTCGSRADAVARIKTARAGYLTAGAAFQAMRPRARENARDFDFWEEGGRLNIFYADFLLSALAGRLDEQAEELLARLSALREGTRELFFTTYEARSVEEELDLRYGFHECYLRALART
jgi:hypothetical protein